MGSPSAARIALGEAETISLAIGADTDSDLGRRIAALRYALRQLATHLSLSFRSRIATVRRVALAPRLSEF